MFSLLTAKRPNIRKTRPGQRKGTSQRRTQVVREVIREVAGLKPYEKRILDMIKTGGGAAEKKIYKFAKMRVSTLHSDACARWAARPRRDRSLVPRVLHTATAHACPAHHLPLSIPASLHPFPANAARHTPPCHQEAR